MSDHSNTASEQRVNRPSVTWPWPDGPVRLVWAKPGAAKRTAAKRTASERGAAWDMAVLLSGAPWRAAVQRETDDGEAALARDLTSVGDHRTRAGTGRWGFR